MKIKEVEQVTGISSQNIRFYEEMGLIQIQRDPENKYREFQETDIKRLKEIKLFRSLDITMEEIRRFYEHEITLEELMDHQQLELASQHEDMKLKQKLCNDIKNSKIPLVSYTVDQYEEIMHHKRETTPIEDAGSLISTWNKTEYSKKRMFIIELCCFPLIWLFTGFLVFFICNIPNVMQYNFDFKFSWPTIIITTIIALIICYNDYQYLVLPNDLYEFREKGIYYLKKRSRKQYHALRRVARRGKIEDYMDFVPYDDIEVFKVWFHVVAKTPINGGNTYQVDFYAITKYDEVIQIDTGMLGVSDEKIKLTAEILCEHAKRVIDPFRIIPALDLDREKFYNYLNEVYYRREHARVFGKNAKDIKQEHKTI